MLLPVLLFVSTGKVVCQCQMAAGKSWWWHISCRIWGTFCFWW